MTHVRGQENARYIRAVRLELGNGNERGDVAVLHDAPGVDVSLIVCFVSSRIEHLVEVLQGSPHPIVPNTEHRPVARNGDACNRYVFLRQ